MIPMIPVSKKAVANRRLYLTNRAELIRYMVGREMTATFPPRNAKIGDVALELRNLRFRRPLSAAEQTPCACTRHPCRTAPPHIPFRFPIASRNRFPCKRPRR